MLEDDRCPLVVFHTMNNNPASTKIYNTVTVRVSINNSQKKRYSNTIAVLTCRLLILVLKRHIYCINWQTCQHPVSSSQQFDLTYKKTKAQLTYLTVNLYSYHVKPILNTVAQLHNSGHAFGNM